MKKIDIKSFLIGVLVTTNIFFFMGFSKSQFHNLVPGPEDEILRKLTNVETELNDLSRDFDSEINELELVLSKKYVKQIHSEVYGSEFQRGMNKYR